jgi:hypothetical protein
MQIKDKKLVELLKKKKEIAKTMGMKASETLDRITSKYSDLKKREAKIQEQLKTEQEAIEKKPAYQEAVKLEDKATGMVAELEAKMSNTILVKYFDKLKENEMFGMIKMIDDETVDIEIVDEVEKFKKRLIESKKQSIAKAKGEVK